MITSKRILMFVLLLFLTSGTLSKQKKCDILNKSRIQTEVILLSEWELLVQAISWVESKNNDNARSTTSSALGRFQQLNSYVVECNRILGRKAFNLEDRLDSAKSRKMFDIYQHYYNPEKDCRKAIILHRGKYSKKYMQSVLFKIYELKDKNRKEYIQSQIDCLL